MPAGWRAEGARLGAADERPQLSVIVPTINDAGHLDACLAALHRQRGSVWAEIVVVDCCGPDVRAMVGQKYPSVHLVSFSERRTIPELRAIGIAHSHGDIVAITEDHCIPAEDWYERIMAAHQAPYAAIGGSVENASTERLVDWAVFLCEYHRCVYPARTGEHVPLPGMNVAYKRESLACLQIVLATGRWENVLHARLEASGHVIYSDPSILVYHRKSFGFGEFLYQRFHYARAFAGGRVEGAGRARRGVFVVGSLALPPLVLSRIAGHLFRRRRHRRVFLKTLPLLSVFTLSWTAGEFVGYLAGPGNSLIKVE